MFLRKLMLQVTATAILGVLTTSLMAQATPTPPVPTMKVSERLMANKEETPTSLPGAETITFRELSPEPLLMHIYKPKGWQATDKRGALIWFFGGGFTRGTPTSSGGWARTAANAGFVGFAPDYRTLMRFGTTPQECLADARYALRYVQEHAEELGIDPEKIVVGGSSAGGGLAIWTAITKEPPGSPESERPLHKPAALMLLCPVSDTSPETGYGASRIGYYAKDVSPLHQMDKVMPPIWIYHGDADETVPYDHSKRFVEALKANGNEVSFFTAAGGTHKFASEMDEWRTRTRIDVVEMLRKYASAEEKSALPVPPIPVPEGRPGPPPPAPVD